MPHFHKLLLIIFLVPLFSVAQNNYQHGVVVTLKGDTLHGYINFKEWDINPRIIFFKVDPLGTPSKFTVNDIRYFRVDVDFLVEYQKYEVTVSTNNINVDNMIRNRDTSFRIDTVFLKVLQKGDRVMLFSYSDELKTRYYIKESSDQIPKELIYRLYYDPERNTQGRTVNENTYLKQLFAIAQKYNVLNDPLQWDIDHSSYTELDILKIVSKINGISAANPSKNNLSISKPFKPALILAAFVAAGMLVVAKLHL